MEQDWVTIATFTYAHDAYIYTARLEAEGIECFLKNELLVQSQHLLSNATGGVELQVKSADAEAAIEILKDGGYVFDVPNDGFVKFLGKVDAIIPTKRLSALGKLSLLVLLFCIVLVVGIYFLVKKGTAEQLIGAWCIEKIVRGDKEYYPYTTDTVAHVNMRYAGCEGPMVLDELGHIQFPGFQSPEIHALWHLDDDDNLVVQGSKIMPGIFNGVYEVEFYSNDLKLISDSMVIYASRHHLSDITYIH